MENSLKQRIVGAVVLIALAIIFLPAILKEKTEQKPFKSQIPEKPQEIVNYKISDVAHAKNRQVQNNLDNAEKTLKQVKQNFENNTDEETIDSITQNTIKSTIDNTENASELAGVAKKKKITSPQDDTDTQNVVTKSETQLKSKSQKAPKEQLSGFKDSAWVIRVASFSNLANAQKLVSSLKAKGHKAYRRSGKDKQNREVHRIFVGPYIKKVNANKQIATISKLSGSTAMVKPYDPIKH